MNRCVESKHLIAIIYRTMYWTFEVERDATTSLRNIPVFLCAVRRYSKHIAPSLLRAPISNGQQLGVAGRIAPCVAHGRSFTVIFCLSTKQAVVNYSSKSNCRRLPYLFLPAQLLIKINIMFAFTLSCTQVIIDTRGLGIVVVYLN